ELSTGSCERCLLGDDFHCPNAERYGQSSFDISPLGTIAKQKEKWLFKIPESQF
ncbi:hypothetical protein K435DRAFT_650065, partial [Dendrothele bispora CBS 962.96]